MVALYPVHAMGVGELGACEDEDTRYFQEQSVGDRPSEYRMRLIHRGLVDAAPGAWADCNPQRTHAPGWHAHLANDAAVCGGASEADVLAYYAGIDADSNAVLVPFGDVAPLMALCTTSEVRQGEELLLAYGHSFWIERLPVPASALVSARQSTALLLEAAEELEASTKVEAACMRQAAQMAEVDAAVTKAYEAELKELGALLAVEAGGVS